LPPHLYNENAKALAQLYLSKSFDEVHQSWSQFLPAIIKNANARILDIGAGSGRDAKHIAQLAEQTHGNKNNIQKIAVEPANLLTPGGKLVTSLLHEQCA
jgi:ubiquinone/menaquinone biosynthesis C-methylase UbiE